MEGPASGDAAFLGVATALPRVPLMGGCCPCRGCAHRGLGTAPVHGPPAASAAALWPLHHPSWGHRHHRNHRTSQGGKAGAM